MINLLKELHLFLLDLSCENGTMLLHVEFPSAIPPASIREGEKEKGREKTGVCNSIGLLDGFIISLSQKEKENVFW